MRIRVSLLLTMMAALTLASVPARADHLPQFVVPARPHVPVIIDGVDASYAVIEGAWGLYRPGHMTPAVIAPGWAPAVYRHGHYFPSTGRRPAYGRREVIPPAHRLLPPPAESYHRYWSAGSDPVPASYDPPPAAPAVLGAPQFAIPFDRRPDRPRARK